MTRSTFARSRRLSAALLASLAGFAIAEPPAALDRVPPTAPVAIGIRNIQATVEHSAKLKELMGDKKEPKADDPFATAKKVLETPGVNKTGSLALAIVPGPDGKVVMGKDEQGNEREDTTGVVIAPVSDFAAFSKAMNAEKGDNGIMHVKIDDKPGFLKDIGGGYAALSTTPGLLEKFEGKAGNTAAHAQMLGKNGLAVADAAEFVIIANVTQLQDQIKDGSKKLATQAEQMGAMMGEQGAQATAGLKVVQMMLDSFSRDGSAGVIGVSYTDRGLTADFGAQFKEGSESAKYFSATGKTSALTAKLPDQPFYFAGSFDTSAPGIKQLFKHVADANKPADGKPATGGMLMTNIDKINGFAGILGASPAALMGSGLFVNTASFTSTPDAKAYMTTAAEELKKTDGVKNGPVTSKVTYNPAAEEVGGVKVDTWAMKMEVDPNDPNAGAVGMMTGMLFGQEGMNGMVAPVEGGVVTVYSKNSKLLATAIETAKSGKGLTQSDSMKTIQEALPADRSMELFIGVKPLAESIIGFVGMMGGAPEVKLPEKITPIAMGATTANGGLTFRIFVASDTLKSIADIGKQMNADEAEPAGDDAPAPKKEDSKPPRF